MCRPIHFWLGHILFGTRRICTDLNKHWSLVAGVENFTDELYQDHLSSALQEFGMNDQPGRNVKQMAKHSFLSGASQPD